MKSFLVISLFISGLIANAQTTFTTSTGSVFTQVHQPQFGLDGSDLAWKDPSGKIWSAIIWHGYDKSDYTNVALEPDQNNLVTKSPATEACAKIGGKLPTEQEFLKLISYFDLDKDASFSNQGRKDFHTLFPDAYDRIFWTSSVVPNQSDKTYLFDAHYGRVTYWGHTPNRTSKGFVRCIL